VTRGSGEALRIGDLRAPILNEAQRQALEYGESTAVDLTTDSVLAGAIERARLDDFGPDDFLERLTLLLSEAAWEGHTALTQLSIHSKLIDVAVNRLLTQDLLCRHPEIHEQEIVAPLIVAGLPRSGTTHLLNLIAADSRFQSLPYWEVLRPVPLLPEDSVGADGVDPRWTRCQRAWEQMQVTNPYVKAYHPLDPDHISEDGELQLGDFASYWWEWFMRAPNWRDYYLAHDQRPHYNYEKTMLKVLQWQRGERRRWIVKAPQHFEQLRVIMDVFPDAMVVFTHRDPVASFQSIATMLAYAGRMRERVLDVDAAYDYWLDRVARLLGAYLRDVDAVPEEQRFDVLFDQFMSDDVAMVERIYAKAGIAMTDVTRRELDRFMETHQRGQHGRIIFDLRRDFGVDPAAVREQFAAYCLRVPVATEAA
jgi:hypothetical protein